MSKFTGNRQPQSVLNIKAGLDQDVRKLYEKVIIRLSSISEKGVLAK
ncbi:MAG: hypothetical protein LWX01_09070 [Deltaproteobacteria bacterium]|nr:hypothetical protein [Deltaproteobacteria bacterium]MDL1961827.1 hypothetical protein [Deltaproteobacteria bacterium]